jgi:lysophospholipase L1-like esterase
MDAEVALSCSGGRAGRWLTALLAPLVIAAAAACGGDPPTGPSPPQLTLQCPTFIDVQSKDGVGAEVAFAPVAAGGTGAISTTCSPAPGTTLPVGSTTVSCTASDAAGQSAGCSFSVRVTSPPRLKYTRFLAFGDSITEGKVSPAPSILMQVAFPGAYPERLHQMLSMRYTAQTFEVLNRGVGGERLARGRARLPGVLDEDRPEVLLLLEGINAIRRVPTATLATDLQEMIESAQRRNVEVLVALLPPVSPAWEEREPGALAAVLAFNEEIRRIAPASGLGEPVDLYTPFAADLSLLIGMDGLHPTEAGYARMAEIFFDAIKDRWELPPGEAPAAR